MLRWRSRVDATATTGKVGPMSDLDSISPAGKVAEGVRPVMPSRSVGVTGVLIVLSLLVAGLLWAKWLPYADKAASLSDSHTWSGSAIFGTSGQPGDAPSLAGAVDFTKAYFAS